MAGMKKQLLTHAFIFIFSALFFFGLSAQLTTPLIIKSGMVVQRDQPIPLWGKGPSNVNVYAILNGAEDSTIISSGGEWNLTLPPMSAGGPYILSIRAENEELTYTDVYIGDVWLASGQSNMQLTLSEAYEPDDEIDTKDNPEIRQFMVARSLKNNTAEEVPAGSSWTPATQGYTGAYSAVGYYFAKYLYAYLDIPIGIINTSYGGTRIESWMSKGVLGFDENDIVFGDGTNWLQPTLAYNAMLYPLRKVPIKGIIWYQGESNSGSREEAILYRSDFRKLINSWRTLFGMEELPFLWVQLPNYGTEAVESSPGTWDAWPLLRESQSSALELKNTGQAVTIDVGDLDIHPKNKQPVGKRLSLAARNVAYKDTLVFSGPSYKSYRKLSGGKVEISFDHIGGGLIAKDNEENELKWFSIVKQNGSIIAANAIIDSNKVIVWNNNEADPLAIRYAWETNPVHVNFYNKADLPATPFYIYVNKMDLNIGTFAADKTHIDRGESAVIRWETFGSDSILFNDTPVERKSALRVWPIEDSVFTLTAIDTNESGSPVTKSIRINVRQPIPTISIISTGGTLVPLDSTLHISAEVSAEGGEPIEKVDFHLNGNLFFSDYEAPFEFDWIADSTGTAIISATVYNKKNVSTTSNVITVFVEALEFIKYEAEYATLTSGGLIKNSDLASNGHYLDLMAGWTIHFDSIGLEKAETNLLYIRYLLNYGSPRMQNLLVNDSLIGNILFTSPDTRTWQDYSTTIPMDSGLNKISIQGVWNYMSIDYIMIGKSAIENSIDTSQIDTSITDSDLSFNPSGFEINAYPNPFQTTITIDFNLPEKGLVKAIVYDEMGRKTELILNETLDEGKHQIIFSPDTNKFGIYFIQFWYKGQSIVKKLVLN